MNDNAFNNEDVKTPFGEDEFKQDFGADFKPLPTEESYYPTRLEFMFAHALQGLIIGRSTKDIDKAVVKAIELAQEALVALDDTTKD